MSVLAFSRGELADLRKTQSGHMMDTCLIAEPTLTQDLYNNDVEAWNWTAAEESVCGLDLNPSREALNQVPTAEAVIRLPQETTISNRARLKVTERFGEIEASPVTYEAVGHPRMGPSGLLVWVRKVTDGS